MPRLRPLRLLAALLAGCSGSGTDTGAACSADERVVSWENWGSGFFAGYCRTCHSAGSANRYGAPESLNYDSEADVYAARASIEQAVLIDSTMPMGGGVPDADLDLLAVFLECGL